VNDYPPSLTKREAEVLAGLLTGLSDKAIAASLGISPSTVKAHISKIFLKTGCASRLEVVVRQHAALAERPALTLDVLTPALGELPAR
jgi:DNA-binding NarL/FixJ family response regulator